LQKNNSYSNVGNFLNEDLVVMPEIIESVLSREESELSGKSLPLKSKTT
jgi:hypothetical protein